ncbi:hypothetical protein M422DRAFT_140817, partial [Sphaerobolus stellatus SS14]
TYKIIEYLTDNIDFRRKLFSDSTRDAKGAGRRKQQAKDQKVQMHATLASYVFAKHEDTALAAEYAADPTRFGRSVGQRLQRLIRLYGDHIKDLGVTGAGLLSDEIIEGSGIANKIGMSYEIHDIFPFWDELHPFWRELLNYNPIAITNSMAQ